MTVGASGTTVTFSVAVVVLVLPSASRSVAVTVSVKFPSSAAVFAVLIVRLDSVHPCTLTEVCPFDAVNVWPWPSLRTAPTGTVLMTSD